MAPLPEPQGSAAPLPAGRTLLTRAVVGGAGLAVLCAVLGRFEFDSEWLYVPWGFGLVLGVALTLLGLAMWAVARLVVGPGAGRTGLARLFTLLGVGGLTLFVVLSALGLAEGEKLF